MNPGWPHLCTPQEAALHERVTAYLHAATSRCVPYAAAAVVLCARVLSGRRPLTAVLVAGLLWLGMLLGELRLVGQVRVSRLLLLRLRRLRLRCALL